MTKNISAKKRFHWFSSDLTSDGGELLKFLDPVNDTIEGTREESLAAFFASASGFEFGIIDDSDSELAYGLLHETPAELRSIKAIDFMHGNVAHMTLRQALHDGLVKGGGLDIRSQAMILGCGYKARVAVSVLAELGYSRISLVTGQNEEATSLDFKQHYFGIQFEKLNFDQVVLQPGINSTVVNTLNLTAEDYGDIFFFNYLTNGGVVVSLTEGDVERDFLTEASALEAKTIAWAQVSQIRSEVQLELIRRIHRS